ncbi:PREDICTED: protein AF-9 [Atta cephalotes]|uniref:YEATS domain-containing protein n=1 Tax=Atta cephalotes TaxID=12957 RepID=A0A158NFJ5_ATTCE|nr:PREDICTED: protein AF-9 [Atta cephalotes]
MAVRITLECGHTSMLRMRSTPEGYTHDWEVFVRGVDNADIHHYIEKVVFLLHDTFRNPKRVLKEPPFVVKESGYAGFIIPIEIYLKNKDEPKKFQISYDLHLQQSGPPINKTIRHVEVIRNPSDDFRKKLLKGGAVVVSSRDGSLEKSDTKTSTMVGKPKLNGSESKKHRITEAKTSNSFHDLFGPPIKTAPVKISPDSKKTSQSDKNLVPKPLVVTEKPDKVDKTIKLKESPHKDSRKDKIDEKKDKKVRDSSKDQLRSKDKSKRPPSPGSKSHSSPGSKRPASPFTTKKPLSPLPTKRSLSPKSKERDMKKITLEKEKDSKEKEKAKNNSRNDIDSSSKSEKKKDKKKHKDDKDKERKDKYKESEKINVKDVTKIIEKKSEKTEKSDKEKFQEHKSSKDDRKSPKTGKENDKVKEDKVIKEKSEKSEKPEKAKDGKYDKDRPKHKHKKREKKDKRDSKDREKKEKRDRNKDESEKQNNTSSLIGNPLSSLLTEIPERDSSDSAPSIDDDSLPESKSILNIKKEPDHVISTIPTETAKPLSPGISVDMKKEKSDRNKRDKSKGSKGEERENRKRKRSKEDDEVLIKREKRGQSTSPPLEPVSSSQSPVAMDVDTIHHLEKEVKKEKDGHVVNMTDNINNKDNDPEQVAPDSTNTTDADISEPPVFSEDYVSQLKDLQQKIMTLQDNDELQRVVQVIAETGQYEITKKTFDFDLCALDRRTVQRLQQFFSAS